MIISNSRKFIFIHIMKAAGTSITKTLDTFLEWNDLLLGATSFGETLQKLYYNRFQLHKHSRALEVRKIIGKNLWDMYFTFTFVRHPFDRAVSLYTWIKGMIEAEGCRRYFPFKLLRKRPFWEYPGTKAFMETNSFSEFIRNKKLLDLAPGFMPQTEWVIDENREVIIDYIGKVETIEKDFQYIASKIDCPEIGIDVHNRSRRKIPNQIIINEDDREYLFNRFRSDFENFGYRYNAGFPE